jgi:transposase, IS30 family
MSFTHLNQPLRYQIEKLLAEGKGPTLIALRLGIHRSTVHRERNRGQLNGHYCAATSHQRALGRRAISAANSRRHSHALWKTVSRQLRQEWSPEQISGRLKLTEGAQGRALSTQSIYDWLSRTDSSLKERLRHYRAPSLWRQGGGGMPKGRPSIRKRPKEVLKREELGHWEGDTVMGRSRKDCLVTAVERKSLYTRISPVIPKLSKGVARYIKRTLTALEARTLTLDNGTEFACYAEMGLPVYFADPGRPRQRSRNENTNGLIRQYVPKGSALSKFSRGQIKRIEEKLNNRPRKTLGYKTPHEVLFNLPPTPVAIRT